MNIYTTEAGSRYVRLSELPHDQRADFERYLRGAGLPFVDNESAIAFEVDYLDFMYSRRSDRH